MESKSEHYRERHRSRSRSRSREGYRSKEHRKEDDFRRKQSERDDHRSKSSGKHRDSRKQTSEYQVSSANVVWGNVAAEQEVETSAKSAAVPEEEKVKTNFGLSGALSKDERTGNGKWSCIEI